MIKELEALERGIIEFEKNLEDDPNNEWLKRTIAGMKKCYQRLEAIDNAKPSEALEKLEMLSDCAEAMKEAPSSNWIEYASSETELDYKLWRAYEDLKQYILKSQEQEKEIAYIEKIKTMMKQKDCVLRYFESDDCFGVRTILSYEWDKLTPELVENNVREEIKPLPLIEKNKQLKAENDGYKRVLEVIKQLKRFGDNINDILEYDTYEDYINSKWNWGYELTEEEFDLLKRYFK